MKIQHILELSPSTEIDLGKTNNMISIFHVLSLFFFHTITFSFKCWFITSKYFPWNNNYER